MSFRRPHNQFVALPAVLRAHGYATLSAHPFERGFWNRAVLHPRYGFSQMLFKRELGTGEVIGWGLADEPFFLRGRRALAGGAAAVLRVPHHPRAAPPVRRVPRPPQGARRRRAGRHAARQLPPRHALLRRLPGPLVAELERGGLWANTVLALHGDHESGVPIDAEVLRLLGCAGLGPVDHRQAAEGAVLRAPSHAAGRSASGRWWEGRSTSRRPCWTLPGSPRRRASWGGRCWAPARPSPCSTTARRSLGERLYVAGGPAIPAGGACFGFPDGAPRPLPECEAARARGREELEMARRVVVHDLVPAAAAPRGAAVAGREVSDDGTSSGRSSGGGGHPGAGGRAGGRAARPRASSRGWR